jgi:hypothetical protein
MAQSHSPAPGGFGNKMRLAAASPHRIAYSA